MIVVKVPYSSLRDGALVEALGVGQRGPQPLPERRLARVRRQPQRVEAGRGRRQPPALPLQLCSEEAGSETTPERLATQRGGASGSRNTTAVSELARKRRRRELKARTHELRPRPAAHGRGQRPARDGRGTDPLQAEALLVAVIAHQLGEARRRRSRRARAELQKLRTLPSRREQAGQGQVVSTPTARALFCKQMRQRKKATDRQRLPYSHTHSETGR